MTIYYKDPRTQLWQPERREASHSAPTREQRRNVAVRTTSEQYLFLKEWLTRREELQGRVAQRGRAIRHILATISLVYIALFFSQPGFTLNFGALGFKQEISLLQIGAIAPLIISYLVLHACHLGITRLRLSHECRIVERELQRFGCPTSYGLLGDWKSYCESQKDLKSHFVSMRAMKWVYLLYDAFLSAAVMVSFVVSGVLAFRSYSNVYASNPHTVIIFALLLIFGASASIVAIVALRRCRAELDRFLEKYLAEESGGSALAFEEQRGAA